MILEFMGYTQIIQYNYRLFGSMSKVVYIRVTLYLNSEMILFLKRN